MGGASAMLAAMLTRRAWMSRVGVVAVVVFAVGGCIMPRAGVEQITPQGPTAETMFKLRSVYANGREPNFDERQQWDSQIEQKISTYLREHPDKANALNVSTFRFLRQVTVGMDQEQVLILLGAPVEADRKSDPHGAGGAALLASGPGQCHRGLGVPGGLGDRFRRPERRRHHAVPAARRLIPPEVP